MEYYHMTRDSKVRQISQNGLIPQNGPQSQSIGDEKKVVFYSQGIEGAIVMYCSFEKMYGDLKGERGDKVIKEYKDYLEGKIDLSEDDLKRMESQLEQIKGIRSTENHREYLGEGPYFSIQDLEVEEIDNKNFNFANSWVTKKIEPSQLQVISLRNSKTGEITTSKYDVIKYMMSKTTPEAIEAMEINDELADYIKRYYEENSEEISRFGSDYEAETISIQEYANTLENSREEQGIELISGQTIGKGVLKEIKNTKEIEKVTHQLENKQKSVEERGE